MKRKTPLSIIKKYTNLIKKHCTLDFNEILILFMYIHEYIHGRDSKDTLIKKMTELKVSGLQASCLIEAIEDNRKKLEKYQLPVSFGLK